MKRVAAAILALGLVPLVPLAAQDPPRPMAVEDLFGLSELGSVALSPDGAWLAATITRPGAPNGCPTCNFKTAGDVWLLSTRTGERRDLTRGTADGSSSWGPVWSQDGRRLVFVSTRPEGDEPRGGDNIRLYAWEAESGTLRRLSDRGVWLRIDVEAPFRPTAPYAWLDDSHVLAALLPEGAASEEQFLYWRRAVTEATRAWAAAADGTLATASVLESGGAAPAPLPTVSLQRLDTEGSEALPLGDLPRWDLWDLTLNLQVAVSPDLSRAAALAVTGTVALRPDRPITDVLRTYAVGLVPLDGSAPLRWAALDPSREHANGELLGWSRDGEQAAVSEGADPGSGGHDRRVLVVSAADGRAVDVTPPAMTARAAAWTSDGRLLLRARVAAVDHAAATSRWDWWLVEDPGPATNMTATLSSVPSTLLAVGDRLLGLADGAILELHADGEPAVRLTDDQFPDGSLSALPSSASGTTDVLVTWSEGNRESLAHVSLPDAPGRATIRPIAFPTESAAFLEGHPGTGTLVFRDETPTGLFVWATDGDGEHPVQALALNEQVAGIAEGRRLLVPYRSADGEELEGLVILPPGYHEGKRYPVATWVYGGLRLHDTRTPLASKHSTRPLNLELLAGHGYVVLVPSIPLSPFGQKSDPWLDIPKAVLPCVDKLVELGIADPDRLAVLGHSTGGYSTYSVVTCTDRFKAAIALSGHPDLVSLHGQLYPGERMSDHAHEGLATAEFVEYGPLNMGGPPTSDLWHYLRNSPLFWIDRVHTPLMIVHGDMDGAPIQQGEEAFNALWRLGRPARFVRYWGEGHVVSSPANVRHLWAQIFDWLDTHLGGTAPTNDR